MYGHAYGKLNFSIVRDARINPSEKVILLALQQWGWKDHECYPAVATIADHTALSERTVQISLKRLEKFGFIKRVPDKSKPTGRRFLLLWLDDPGYLPPLREKKPRLNRKSKAKPAESEAEVVAWTSKRTRELIDEGHDEVSIFEHLVDDFGGQREHSDEAWAWHETTREEVTNAHFYPQVEDTPPEPWSPGDPARPTRQQVGHWVLARLAELYAADPHNDEPDAYVISELAQAGCDDEVLQWCDEAIGDAVGRKLR